MVYGRLTHSFPTQIHQPRFCKNFEDLQDQIRFLVFRKDIKSSLANQTLVRLWAGQGNSKHEKLRSKPTLSNENFELLNLKKCLF